MLLSSSPLLKYFILRIYVSVFVLRDEIHQMEVVKILPSVPIAGLRSRVSVYALVLRRYSQNPYLNFRFPLRLVPSRVLTQGLFGNLCSSSVLYLLRKAGCCFWLQVVALKGFSDLPQIKKVFREWVQSTDGKNIVGRTSGVWQVMLHACPQNTWNCLLCLKTLLKLRIALTRET